MEKLVCVLDNLVYRLKEKSDFSDVRFVHSGRDKYVEKPVESFLVACGVQSESLVPMEGIGGKLEFMVYAPSGEGKRSLGVLCENMAQALSESDADNLMEEIYIEAAAFDSNLTVWRQGVIIKVSLPESDVQQESLLTICGKDVSAVTSFSALCNRDYHVVRELLGGDTGERVVTKESFVLTVTSKGVEDIFAAHPKGGITIFCKGTQEEFLNCMVEKSTLKYTSSHPEREYSILCTDVRKAE